MGRRWARPHLKAAVFVSPAFALTIPGYHIMKHVFHALPSPLAYSLLWGLAGKRMYSIKVANAEQPKYWTVTYPISALLAIFELYHLVEYRVDYKAIDTPVLAFASKRDTVV